ncbi:MAG: aminoacetone oxidase family FAD-binding enzyme [Lachnospiraceae bacterium]|nr:aminoacetone oxidase family FAD-binding enzyme [Lachnospiraceae bacterium]
MLYDVIIIGSGAAGLMAAISALNTSKHVLILDKNQKAGRKISASGNGKCNFTNMVMGEEYYNGESSFVSSVLKQFNEKDTIELFRKIGIYPKIKNNYVYPYSEQAASVVACLVSKVVYGGGIIKFDEYVTDIKKEEDIFYIKTSSGEYASYRLIIATGGVSYSQLGADGAMLDIIEGMGHHIVKPLKGLVGLICKKNVFRNVSGVRVNANIALEIASVNKKPIKVKNSGEVIFNESGISGIPIMQISRYASKALDEGRKVKVYIDFIPELEEEELYALLKERRNNMNVVSIYELLIGLINNKLAGFLDREKLDINNDKNLLHMAKYIKRFAIPITQTNGWDNAQVMAGGIDTSEIDSDMQSKIVEGLYFAGEIMDVDGTCGGYNLQWAWSTGFIAGKNAVKMERGLD